MFGSHIVYVMHFVVCDRKKKVEIRLVQEDFDEIKHEHKISHTHSTIFTIGLSQIMFRPKLRENVPVNTSDIKP